MAVVRDNPYSNVNFIVEVDGVAAAGFSEVDLPEGRIDVIEYREGSDKTSDARKLPGRVGYVEDIASAVGMIGRAVGA